MSDKKAEERKRAIRLLNDVLAEVDAGLILSAKAGIHNAINFLESETDNNPGSDEAG